MHAASSAPIGVLLCAASAHAGNHRQEHNTRDDTKCEDTELLHATHDPIASVGEMVPAKVKAWLTPDKSLGLTRTRAANHQIVLTMREAPRRGYNDRRLGTASLVTNQARVGRDQ